MNSLDQFTLGKTPACIKMIELLNEDAGNNQRLIFRMINSFRDILSDLSEALQHKHISTMAVEDFIELKLIDLYEYENTKLSENILDLYKQIIMEDIEKFCDSVDHIVSENFPIYEFELPLDTYALGRAPASIYLISQLNASSNPKDLSVLRMIDNFRHIFSEFNEAVKEGQLNSSTVLTYCKLKREELNSISNTELTPLIENLYKNVVLSDIKQFSRTHSNIKKIEHSARDRAKNMLKDDSLLNKTVNTFGKLSKNAEVEYPVAVSFNQHGRQKIDAQFDKYQPLDGISNDSLLEKFIAKHKAKGKDYNL